MTPAGGRRLAFRVLIVAATMTVATAVAGARPAQAQDDPEPPALDTSSPPRVTARFNIDWLNAARGTWPVEGALNPGNVRLWLPQALFQSEIRGNLRVEFGSRAQAIVRPRLRGAVSMASANDLPRRDVTESDAEWTELYGTWLASDVVSFTYGLQNFQWGPAELLAPNNRIFHESGLFRDPLYYVRGKHLLRVNLSAGRQWSVVALAELSDNGDAPFRAGETFARQGLAKVEYTTANGASYGGLTAGATEGTPPWLGAYGSVAINEGLSVYADASLTRGSQAWYPVRLPSGLPAFARSKVADHSTSVLAVVGARYTFARGDDLRVEALFNDAGWTRDDMRLGWDAARLAPSREAFAPYLAPGLEYVGRRFLYVSLRNPELPPAKHTQVQTRYLQSLTDDSRVFFVTASLDATDAMVLFTSVTVTGGPAVGEFSRLARGSLVLGATYTW